MKFTANLIKAFCAATFIVASTSTLSAASDFENISKFVIEVNVKYDGSIDVVESITYDFGLEERHGIFREIPIRDEMESGKYWFHPVSITSVKRDGVAEQYSLDESGLWSSLLIGNPDSFINGVHNYEINYTVKGALFPITADDAKQSPGLKPGDITWYWDVIGNSWEVPIQEAIVKVNLPPGATDQDVIAKNCVYGRESEKNPCLAMTSVLAWYSSHPLEPGEAMTISMQFNPTIFSPDVARTIDDGPTDVFSPYWLNQFKSALPVGGALALIAIATLSVLRRRWLSKIKTARVTETVQFSPPPGLVAEISAAWKGKVDSRALTATLLDLASRGVVGIHVNGNNMVVEKKLVPVNLADFETVIVQTLFEAGDRVEISGYQPALSEAMNLISESLVEAAEARGVRNENSTQARLPFTFGIAVSAVLSFVGVMTIGAPHIFGIVLPLTTALFFFFVVAFIKSPQIQTESSAAFLSHVLGFKRAMDTESATLRREFAHRSGLTAANIFATYLPFAVIFELEEAWLSSFPDLTPQDLQATGLYVASIGGLQHSLQQTHDALMTAMTAPTSSGSGSDGGSSGGGGGGGGGGSW